jgi:cell division protein FtsQ
VSAISTWHPARGVALPADESLVSVRAGSRVGRWFVMLAGLAIVLGAGWWVTNSPVFDMRNLTIQGNAHLSARQVASLSGLDARTNVMWLSHRSVEDRLEADPWILDATISRHLPSGITVDVVERVPTAVTQGDHPMLVAGDGMVLGPASSTVSARLPAIAAPTHPVALGDRLPDSPELTAAAVLPPSVRPLVGRITRDGDGALVLLMRDGVTVFYGDSSHAAAKATALRMVLAWATQHSVQFRYVDVRAPAVPALGTTAPPGLAERP